MEQPRLQGKFENETFKNETITLDGSSFRKCTFSACVLVYEGGAPPDITGCGFERCKWKFGAEAANTMMFLSGFYKGGFADLVEQTFHEVRKGSMLAETPAPKETPGERSFFGISAPKIIKVPKKKR